MQAYSISINLPQNFNIHDCQEITKKYIEVFTSRKLDWVQAYETENHKYHSHISYLAKPQKSTSNETKLFNHCYPFAKQDYPRAIKHVKHNNWQRSVGYTVKENLLDHTYQGTILNKKFIKECSDAHQKHKKWNGKPTDQLSINQIYTGFIVYLKTEGIILSYDSIDDNPYDKVKSYLKTIKENVSGSTFQKLRYRKMVEYAKLFV